MSQVVKAAGVTASSWPTAPVQMLGAPLPKGAGPLFVRSVVSKAKNGAAVQIGLRIVRRVAFILACRAKCNLSGTNVQACLARQLTLQVLLLVSWLQALRLLQAGTAGGFLDAPQLPESGGLMRPLIFCSRTRTLLCVTCTCADG